MADKYGVVQDVYCYPGTHVLINKLHITDEVALNEAELTFTQYRIEEFIPNFDTFSLATLQSIHYFLFQDLYAWAGELRTVDISKGNTLFANVRFFETEANKLFQQLKREEFLITLPQDEFIQRLAHYYSELNVVHPFRDGNGRAQRVLFEALAINAGYEIRWQAIETDEWLPANIAAYHCKLGPLIGLLQRSISRLPES
jgi:cell filamentation protein